MATVLVPRVVPQPERYKYGISSMVVLATNNASNSSICDGPWLNFPPRKRIGTVGNPDFVRTFNSRMHSPIIARIQALLPEKSEWALHVFRMGFWPTGDMPIVVHVLVPHGCIPESDAHALVQEIGNIVTVEWEGEVVYVDVCQKILITSDLRQDDEDNGVDLLQKFHKLYDYDPPSPGFSIGPKNSSNIAGSFTGFIKIQDRVYGLTCEHVVNGKDSTILGLGAYNYEDGKEKFMVTMPAGKDHETTQRRIRAKALSAQQREDAQINDGITRPGVSTGYWESINEKAQEFVIEVGHVVATSGRDKSRTWYQGCLDWAYFDCGSRFNNTQNRHLSWTGIDTGSAFELRDERTKRRIREILGADFMTQAHEYFSLGPNYRPLRETEPRADEIFFKVASRSSNLREAQYNGIKATLNTDNRGVTFEDCYVCLDLVRQASEDDGDSGAPLIDSEFRPTAMVWGGNNINDGFEDVTYATPLHQVLRDIERRGGLTHGSVTYC